MEQKDQSNQEKQKEKQREKEKEKEIRAWKRAKSEIESSVVKTTELSEDFRKNYLELMNAHNSPQPLVELKLRYMELTELDVKALSQALMVNTTLKDLSLKHNKISEKGLMYLCFALTKNQSLEHLDIRDTQLNMLMINIIISTLSRNFYLNRFSLEEGFHLPQHLFHKIKFYLNQNKKILEVKKKF